MSPHRGFFLPLRDIMTLFSKSELDLLCRIRAQPDKASTLCVVLDPASRVKGKLSVSA